MIDPFTRLTRIAGHFGLLFSFLMVELAILPLFEGNLMRGAVGDMVFLLLVYVTLFFIPHRRLFGLSTALFIFTLASYIGFLFNQQAIGVIVVVNLLVCLFIVTVIIQMLGFILQSDRITLDGVMGGLCVYLLVGFVFTLLYLTIELLAPGSFDFGIHGKTPDFLQIYDLLYFYSYVTLLTIGYGDIVPLSHIAQTLSVLEGVIGQFYVVFFVAVLVGIYLYGRLSDQQDSNR